MIAPAYYRSLLSPDEQDVYKDIVLGLLRRSPAIFIRQEYAQPETIRKIVNAVHLDHPELFSVRFWDFHMTRVLLPPGAFLHFQMMLDAEPSNAVLGTLNAKAARLQTAARQVDSPAERYLLIAKEIASTTKYVDTDSGFWEHTIAGPGLRGQSVCEGIAKTFLFFCQRLNLRCAVATGTMHGIPHAWNVVELDGVIKYVDVTASLQSMNLHSILPGTFFKSEQALRRNGYDW